MDKDKYESKSANGEQSAVQPEVTLGMTSPSQGRLDSLLGKKRTPPIRMPTVSRMEAIKEEEERSFPSAQNIGRVEPHSPDKIHSAFKSSEPSEDLGREEESLSEDFGSVSPDSKSNGLQAKASSGPPLLAIDLKKVNEDCELAEESELEDSDDLVRESFAEETDDLGRESSSSESDEKEDQMKEEKEKKVTLRKKSSRSSNMDSTPKNVVMQGLLKENESKEETKVDLRRTGKDFIAVEPLEE